MATTEIGTTKHKPPKIRTHITAAEAVRRAYLRAMKLMRILDLVVNFGLDHDDSYDTVLEGSHLDENATAQNILDAIQRLLIDFSTCAGDVSVFFYSGHGSQIRNMFVKDENSPFKYDQTLVPYEATDGVPDIQSKELVRLYLAAARKGIYLTVIADSCQSGGLSRGGAGFSSKGKYAPRDTRYVNDPGQFSSS